jgi:drug/metabolite transporter (DMT)-like permease
MKKLFLNYLTPGTAHTSSILWMLLSCFLSSVMAAITKHVAADMPALQMVFFRNFFAVLCLFPWAFSYGLPHIKASNFRLYFPALFPAFLP